MPRCSVCDDGAALLCGACVDAALAASRARLAQARRAEADWKARADAAPARPPEIDVDADAAGLAKTLLAVARRVHADRASVLGDDFLSDMIICDTLRLDLNKKCFSQLLI